MGNKLQEKISAHNFQGQGHSRSNLRNIRDASPVSLEALICHFEGQGQQGLSQGQEQITEYDV